MNLATLLLHHEGRPLNAAYAAALDEKRFDDWPEFFVKTAATPCRPARTSTVACRWP
jgi:3-phenylpropionate/cinnamic acid dioxygenase small subunit